MFGVILDNVWVQFVLFLIFIFYGVSSVIEGANEVDKRRQMGGIRRC